MQSTDGTYSLELLKILDTKILTLCKKFDNNILYQYIFFVLSISNLIGHFGSDNQFQLIHELFPEQILGFKLSKVIVLLPLIVVLLFIQFGFLSLKLLRLLTQRDIILFNTFSLKMINIAKEREEVIDNLRNVKSLFRNDGSLAGVFYRTMIFKGIDLPKFREELTQVFFYFTYIFVIAVVILNTGFALTFSILYLVQEIYLLGAPLLLGMLLVAFCYYDYLKKVFALRREVEFAYQDNFPLKSESSSSSTEQENTEVAI